MQFHDDRVMRFWAQRLNIERDVLDEGGVAVIPSAESGSELIVYTIGDKQIAALPAHLQSRWLDEARAHPAALEDVAHQLKISLTFRSRCFIYYATTPIEQSVPFENARVLTAADAPLLDALQAACTASELSLSEITINDPLVVGHFDGERLIGVASVLDQGSDVFDIGVLTHPAYRGRHVAVMLAAYLRNHYTALGKIAQYVTMEYNGGSVRVAEKCGFDLVVTEESYAVADG